jgi:iron complex outermembrane receptor protein
MAPGSETRDVEGQVTDSTGAVVVGASVTLQSTSGSFRRDAATDARGHYRFSGVPAGGYLVIAVRDGFSPQTEEISVGSSGSVTRDLMISPASFSEEVTVSFTGAHSTALKTDTPVRDIPLSVQSYTSSFMKAIEATKVADLYGYTLGVSRVADNAAGFVIRGLRADSEGQNIKYNGLPGLAGRFGSPSTANVERIEVLKGPASVLYGQAQPGGIVNIVTKKPQAERSNLFEIRGGTFSGRGPSFGDANKYHVATDLTGPFDRGRKVLYRMIASYDDEGSFRDFVKNRDLYVVPSLSWLGWEGTILNLEVEYRRTRTSSDDGLVAPNNDITRVAPITTRYQEPGDFLNEDAKTASLSLKKVFAAGLTWSTSWRSVWHGDVKRAYGNLAISGTTLTRREGWNDNTRRYHFLDTTLNKALSTGSVRHGLLFGLYGGYELSDFNRLQFASASSLSVNIYTPVYGKPGLPSRPDTHQHIDFRTYAAYLNDQIELTPKLKALAGLRVTRHQTRHQELRINPFVKNKRNGAVLPLAGLVFQPDSVWSLYGSFSTSFTPPAAALVDASGVNSFDPERARQYEVGLKAALGRDRGEATLSLFDIKKKDVIIGVGAGISEQFGEQRSRGVEAQVNHRILDHWQVILGYAYVDSSVISEKPRPGEILPTQVSPVNAPKHSANLWSRYDIPGGPLRGLGVGLGFVYSAKRAGTLAQPNLPLLLLPSYTRLDAGLYYVTGRYELTARTVNLLDELYYESSSGINIRPADPRQASLSLRVKF